MIFGRFPFADSPDTAAITCCHVLAGTPILRVTHDAEDGMWQFLCGQPHGTDEARVISLKEAFSLDASLQKIARMSCGCIAERESAKGRWIISRQ